MPRRALLALAAPLVAALVACGADDRKAPSPPSGAPALSALSIAQRSLAPAFSPDVHDYSIPCSAGNNPLTFTATAAEGAEASWRAPLSRPVRDGEPVFAMIPEDSAVVVDVRGAAGATESYWIRCLPSDFPELLATRSAPTRPGWYLAGNPAFAAGERGYAMVLDENLTPIWYRRVGDDGAGLVTLLGKNRIAYTHVFGFLFGTEPGRVHFVENLETGVRSEVGLKDVPTDQHELVTTPGGRYALLSYPVKDGYDLSSLGIADTKIADCRVEEVAEDGTLVWAWDASAHLDVATESTALVQANVNGALVRDVWHCNSIDPQPNGDLVISLRHADAVLRISRATGKVLWKLGGTPVNKDGATILRVLDDPEGAFLNQHDARILPDGRVSLFDNHSRQDAPARGLELALDLAAGTARITWQYASTAPWHNSVAMGSFRSYPTGERVIGWGVYGDAAPAPAMLEVDEAGRTLLELALARGGHTYRVTKVDMGALDRGLLRASAGRFAR